MFVDNMCYTIIASWVALNLGRLLMLTLMIEDKDEELEIAWATLIGVAFIGIPVCIGVLIEQHYNKIKDSRWNHKT